MKKSIRRLSLRPDTIRIMTSLDGVVGGRVTSIPTLCYLEAKPDTRPSAADTSCAPCAP